MLFTVMAKFGIRQIATQKLLPYIHHTSHTASVYTNLNALLACLYTVLVTELK